MKVPSNVLPAIKMTRVLFHRLLWSLLQINKIIGISSEDHISSAIFQPMRSAYVSQ